LGVDPIEGTMANAPTRATQQSLGRLEGLPALRDDAVPAPASQAVFWAELAVAAVVIAVCFAAADWFLMPRLERWAVADQVVDVQTPSMMYAKLDYLRRHQGFRAAFLGDSVSLGLSLREHGDADWLQHQPAALLEQRLRQAHPGEDALVMNLAINGALPADLACLSKLLGAANPDLVVCDIGLRGFSADFNDPDKSQAREWLARMHIDPTGACRMDPGPKGGWQECLQARLWNHWLGYRLADLMQQIAFDGQPRDYALTLRHRLDHWAKARRSSHQRPQEGSADDAELLMMARSRFLTIGLDPQLTQPHALQEFLGEVKQRGWKTLVFYAREKPDVRDALIDEDRYVELRQELVGLFNPYLSPSLRYHPGAESLEPRVYLDHVHVNAEGYRRLMDALWPEIEELLSAR
jgi:lysophospholipase L1-like esterase